MIEQLIIETKKELSTVLGELVGVSKIVARFCATI
ncbi:hypothetical protein NIES4102_21490 [Chondrocystis sp. NIES-4102]|nr:hypothetical protein NIES4102_12360 [Chondrocystis sp. NIES-4102]BAZ45131.1 hypothetical protein NIES4102_21490 [Chondrocystis sp. NIES-4102]